MEGIRANHLLPVEVIDGIERLENGEALSLAHLSTYLCALETALAADPTPEGFSAMAQWQTEMTRLKAEKPKPKQGFMYSWGCGWDGRLGQGNTDNQLQPALAPLEQAVVSISCGWGHTAAVTADGAVVTWGLCEQGQLGRGNAISEADQMIPAQVPQFGSRVLSVVCGYSITLAIDEQGALFSWGTGEQGQLGLGESCEASTPQLVSTDQPITSVSCCRYHCLAVSNSGGVYSWGRGEYGQLGLGKRDSERVPQRVVALDECGIVATGCGWGHSIAVSSDGKLYSWGFGGKGQLGHGNMQRQEKPTKVAALSGVTLAACGYYHNVAATDAGVFSWGRAERGQLGHGDCTNQLIPTPIAALAGSQISQLSCGDNSSAALAIDGRLWLWGRGTEGQLGGPATEDLLAPVLHNSLSSSHMKAIACGWGHSAAMCDSPVADASSTAGAATAQSTAADSAVPAVLLDDVLAATGRDYGNFLRFPAVEANKLADIDDVVQGMLSKLDQFGAICDTLQFDTARNWQQLPRLFENATKMQNTFDAIDQVEQLVEKLAATQNKLLESVAATEVQNDCQSTMSKISSFFSSAPAAPEPMHFSTDSIPDTHAVFNQLRTDAGGAPTPAAVSVPRTPPPKQHAPLAAAAAGEAAADEDEPPIAAFNF